MVRRLVEQEQVGRHDPEQGQLEPGALAARQRPDLLERVVAPEQEPGQVAARLAGRDRDRLEDRVEHGGAGDRRPAELGEVADRHAATEGQDAVERGQLAGHRPEQGRLAGAIRADDADPIPALGGEERHPGDDERRAELGRRR